MLRQLGHGLRPLARLPFPGAAPPTQVILGPARGQFRSPRAWALRPNLSFYDALYVALAAALGAPW